MSCYSPHPTEKNHEGKPLSCWHAVGHRGDHGSHHATWPNVESGGALKAEVIRFCTSWEMLAPIPWIEIQIARFKAAIEKDRSK